jgi:hypothetical protein
VRGETDETERVCNRLASAEDPDAPQLKLSVYQSANGTGLMNKGCVRIQENGLGPYSLWIYRHDFTWQLLEHRG